MAAAIVVAGWNAQIAAHGRAYSFVDLGRAGEIVLVDGLAHRDQLRENETAVLHNAPGSNAVTSSGGADHHNGYVYALCTSETLWWVLMVIGVAQGRAGTLSASLASNAALACFWWKASSSFWIFSGIPGMVGEKTRVTDSVALKN